MRTLFLPENQLIIAIRTRERAGAEALYEMYAKSLYGVIVKIVLETAIAEDLLQETFIRIWDQIDRYDADKGRLFTWMVTIARNLSRDMLRSGKYKLYRKSTGLEELDLSYAVNTDTIGVKQLMALLKADQQAIFELIYYKGYTHQEVSEFLAMPLGTVKTKWRAGISVLRDIYRQKLPKPIQKPHDEFIHKSGEKSSLVIPPDVYL